jgi:hypothetical protein
MTTIHHQAQNQQAFKSWEKNISKRININRRKHDKDDTAFDTFDWYASATLAPVSLAVVFSLCQI